MTTTIGLFRVLAIPFTCALVAALPGAGCGAETSPRDDAPGLAETDVDAIASPLSLSSLCFGEECASLVRGARAFIDRRPHGLGGNGRSCADCHMPTDSFQLSPANAERRFQRLQARRAHDPGADDPLFRPIDADDFRSKGDAASDYGNLRDNGLIRIAFPLPPTLRLIDPVTNAPSAETFVDVWRAVPTVNNVKLTGPDRDGPGFPCVVPAPPGVTCVPRGPNPRGGYQLDARVATLQEQALGALTNHAQVQRAPTRRMLDDLTNFQNSLFSSHALRLASGMIDAGVGPEPDPDPPLDPLEQQGNKVFARACATCHADAAGTHPLPGVVRFHNIFTACPRPVDGPQFPGYTGVARFKFAACKPQLARNVRLYEITLPDGTRTRRASSDPGRTLSTGFFIGSGSRDDWQSLEVSTTRGAARTAPYFHNNSAASFDELLDHYTEFFNFVAAVTPPFDANGTAIRRPPPISTDGVHIDRPFTKDERPALVAYLRRL